MPSSAVSLRLELGLFLVLVAGAWRRRAGALPADMGEVIPIGGSYRQVAENVSMIEFFIFLCPFPWTTPVWILKRL